MRAAIFTAQEEPWLKYFMARHPAVADWALITEPGKTTEPPTLCLLDPELAKQYELVKKYRKRFATVVLLKEYSARAGVKVSVPKGLQVSLRDVVFSKAAKELLTIYARRSHIAQAVRLLGNEIQTFSWADILPTDLLRQPIFVYSDEEQLGNVPLAFGLRAKLPEHLAELLRDEDQADQVLFLLLFARPTLEQVHEIMLKNKLPVHAVIAYTSVRKYFGLRRAMYKAVKYYIVARDVLPSRIIISPAAQRVLRALIENVPRSVGDYIEQLCIASKCLKCQQQPANSQKQ